MSINKMLEERDSIENIEKEVAGCMACPLYKHAANPVPGEGNISADIMFIGEAPGKKEDELGRPFVGTAGKLLDELLASIKLDRNDVYIANVVKHRPPNNRDPLPLEVEACWPYLKRQIAIISPKVIVLLGRHALQRFLPGKVIGEAHGRALRAGRQVYFPVYHPAAALYSQKLRPTLFADIARLPKIIKLIEEENVAEEKDVSAQGKLV